MQPRQRLFFLNVGQLSTACFQLWLLQQTQWLPLYERSRRVALNAKARQVLSEPAFQKPRHFKRRMRIESYVSVEYKFSIIILFSPHSFSRNESPSGEQVSDSKSDLSFSTQCCLFTLLSSVTKVAVSFRL